MTQTQAVKHSKNGISTGTIGGELTFHIFGDIPCFGARSASGLSTKGLEHRSTHVEVPSDIVFQVLLLRFRYKLSLRDVAEIFLLRGFEFTHEIVRNWEERFASLFAQHLRAKRQGKASKSWYVDQTGSVINSYGL